MLQVSKFFIMILYFWFSIYVINYSEFLLHGIQVFVANIGDAKAVVARSSTTNGSGNHSDGASQLKAIVLTREHKAIYPQERARIQKVYWCVLSCIVFIFPYSLLLDAVYDQIIIEL